MLCGLVTKHHVDFGSCSALTTKSDNVCSARTADTAIVKQLTRVLVLQQWRQFFKANRSLRQSLVFIDKGTIQNDRG